MAYSTVIVQGICSSIEVEVETVQVLKVETNK